MLGRTCIVRDLLGTRGRGTLRVTNVRDKLKTEPTVKIQTLPDCLWHTHTHTQSYTPFFSLFFFLQIHTCLTPMALSLLALTHLYCYLSAQKETLSGNPSGLAARYVCEKERRERWNKITGRGGCLKWVWVWEFIKQSAMGKWTLLCNAETICFFWEKQSSGFVVGQITDTELQQTVYTTRIWAFNKFYKRSY